MKAAQILGLASVPTIALVAVIATTVTKDVPPPRVGFSFPITHDTAKFRYNVRVLPDCRLPAKTWNSASFLSTIRASSGTFPVQLWRIRKGKAARIAVLNIPAAPCATTERNVFFQYQLPAASFQVHDEAVIEWTPGMFAARRPDARYDHPDASMIDNRSNDAVTLQSFRREFSVAE